MNNVGNPQGSRFDQDRRKALQLMLQEAIRAIRQGALRVAAYELPGGTRFAMILPSGKIATDFVVANDEDGSVNVLRHILIEMAGRRSDRMTLTPEDIIAVRDNGSLGEGNVYGRDGMEALIKRFRRADSEAERVLLAASVLSAAGDNLARRDRES